VYIEGDEDPHRATLLGTSECSDLAVIDIDGGGYPFAEWRNENIESFLDVYAIGYPAEDVPAGEKPDQTVTSGIINTTEANGDLPWASVDKVIEHEATIRPGNSGGALVDDQGKVVGINFAGDSTERYLAVSRDETQDLLPDLESSKDVWSIGINGEAYADPDEGFSGILVVSVKTGSPAFDVGIQGLELDEDTGEPTQFDVITELEGTRLAEDQTMNTYCEVLRGHDTDDPLTIEVERYEVTPSGELTDFAVLDGVLNGDELKKNEDKTQEQLQQ
jgi:serine protease Do